MNEALSVPSPSRFCTTFGRRSPALNTSACNPVPKAVAMTRSRTRPAMRLRKMPAAISSEATPERAGGGVGEAPAVSFMARIVLLP